jgi:hypothetical protein
VTILGACVSMLALITLGSIWWGTMVETVY